MGRGMLQRASKRGGLAVDVEGSVRFNSVKKSHVLEEGSVRERPNYPGLESSEEILIRISQLKSEASM